MDTMTTTNNDTIISRILALAEAKGLSQRQLAQSIGVNPQTITNWKSRPGSDKASIIPSDKLALCAKVLGCSADYLLGLTQVQGCDFSIHAVVIQTDEQILGKQDQNDVAGVLISAHQFSYNAFGYIVKDESASPMFKPGDEIIVDPSVPAGPGSVVLAIVDGNIYLRKFRSPRINQVSLFALNLDYPSFEEPGNEIKILGPIIEHRILHH